MKVDENKNKKLPRKLRKIIVEKKRRERIDSALKQLKDMLFGSTELQNDYMRMEKADILENVVKYLQTQQNSAHPPTHSHSPASCDAQYRLGYLHCVREVRRAMEHLCGAHSQLTLSLAHYLNAKVSQMSHSSVSRDESRSHAHAQSQGQGQAHKSEDIPTLLRAYPECTSATGIPPRDYGVTSRVTSPEQRVPPLTPSANSAFQKVHSPQSYSPSPHTDFQKVHSPKSHSSSSHSAFQNKHPTRPQKPSANDNISIAVYQYNHYNNYKNDKARTHAESNINIRPVIKVETQSSPQQNSFLNSTGESSDLDGHIQGQMDDSFIHHEDSDMWRPW